MIKYIHICLILLIVSTQAYAASEEDEAPESDVGLSAESAPEDSNFQIPEVAFTVIDDEPVLDGNIDDDFWKQALTFSLDTELYPIRFAPAVVETRAWVGVSKTHVFVAFDARDPDPEEMRSALRERDATKEDDYVSIIIDPTGTLAKKYEFRVNPHGTLSDVLQDTISDRYIYDWDTEWEGVAKINQNGYTVEIAIPKGSIRSPEVNEGLDHKGAIILKRSYPRRVDRTLATFLLYSTQAAATSPQTDIPRPATTIPIVAESSSASGPDQTVGVDSAGKSTTSSDQRGVAQGSSADKNDEQQSKLTYRPHYIYHLDEDRAIGGEFEQVDEHKKHEVGIDLDYQISSAQTLSVTINPNYTDVEADIARQSINNPFVVFQPEKRHFFKASLEYYNTLVPTVYTRNIIQPQWGASYIRDDIYSSFGALGVNDKETEVIVPDTFGSDEIELLETSNSAAVRYRYSKDKRSFGLVGTLRTADGYHNGLFGVDGLWDLSPDDKLRYQVLYSDTQYPQRFAEDLCEEDGCTIIPPPDFCPLGSCSTNAQVLRTDFTRPLSDYAVKFRYKHDGPDSLYWVTYEDFAPDFRADMGYQHSVDIRTFNLAYGRKWYVDTFSDDKGKSRIRGYAVYTHSRSHEDDNQVEDGFGLWAEFRGSYQSVFRLGKRFRERAVNRINQNSLATGINSPLFDEDYWQWYLETSPWTNWTLNLDGRWGEIADSDNLVLGDMEEIKPKIVYRVKNWRFLLETTFRNFILDGSPLYKERFFSFTTSYRKNSQIRHRLLYLNDDTRQDTSRWLGDALDKEVEERFEYTFFYEPTKKLLVLAGFKAESEFVSDINDGGITNREVYIKIEAKL